MQLKNVENKPAKLYRNNLIDTILLKENVHNLLKLKKLYYSKLNISKNLNNVCVNTNVFFPTEKIVRYKGNIFPRFAPVNRISSLNKIRTLFKKKNIILKCNIINFSVENKLALDLFHDLSKFRYSLFSKNYTYFFDLCKILSLVLINKENITLLTPFLGLVFRKLSKKKHNLFVSFLKYLMNLIIKKYKKNLIGIKFIINGKLQGKTRASTVKLQSGNVSINNIESAPLISKAHVYTSYGAYGIKMLACYK